MVALMSCHGDSDDVFPGSCAH